MSNIYTEEEIGDDQLVYRAIKYKLMIQEPPKRMQLIERKIPPNLIINEAGDGMSVDWEKHTDPEGTQERKGGAQECGVVQFLVSKIKDFEDKDEPQQQLQLHHKPKYPNEDDPTDNQAHSLIIGIPSKEHDDFQLNRGLLTRIRQYLSKVAVWRLFNESDFQIQVEIIKEQTTSGTLFDRAIQWPVFITRNRDRFNVDFDYSEKK